MYALIEQPRTVRIKKFHADYRFYPHPNLSPKPIFSSGQADMVALARGMLYDPRWPWHAAAKLAAQVDVPKQYLRSQPRELKNLFKA